MTDLDETSGFPSEDDPGFSNGFGRPPTPLDHTLFSPGKAEPSPRQLWDRSTWDPNSLGAVVFGQPVAPYRSPGQVQTDATHALLTGPSHPGWSEPITRAAIDSMMAAIPIGPRPDGLLSDGLRLLAVRGHPDPDLQAWAAKDAALRNGAHPLSALWAMNANADQSQRAGATLAAPNPDGRETVDESLPQSASPSDRNSSADQAPDQVDSSAVASTDPIPIAGNDTTPQAGPPATATPTPNYKLANGIIISDALGRKAEPIAAAVRDATGRAMIINSTLRTPRAQAAAMFNNLEKNTPASYVNKAAAQEINDAYRQAKAAGKSSADTIAAMQSQIDRQVARGVYVSKHLLDGALDVRIRDAQNRIDPAMRAAVIKAAKAQGAMVYPEADHIHVQPK